MKEIALRVLGDQLLVLKKFAIDHIESLNVIKANRTIFAADAEEVLLEKIRASKREAIKIEKCMHWLKNDKDLNTHA